MRKASKVGAGSKNTAAIDNSCTHLRTQFHAALKGASMGVRIGDFVEYQ
jgi:hypothetical protein